MPWIQGVLLVAPSPPHYFLPHGSAMPVIGHTTTSGAAQQWKRWNMLEPCTHRFEVIKSIQGVQAKSITDLRQPVLPWLRLVSLRISGSFVDEPGREAIGRGEGRGTMK